MQVAISCLVLINLTLKEPERNMFSAKEDRLDWIANRTYLAEWVRAWLLKPDYSDLILALLLAEPVIWRSYF